MRQPLRVFNPYPKRRSLVSQVTTDADILVFHTITKMVYETLSSYKSDPGRRSSGGDFFRGLRFLHITASLSSHFRRAGLA